MEDILALPFADVMSSEDEIEDRMVVSGQSWASPELVELKTKLDRNFYHMTPQRTVSRIRVPLRGTNNISSTTPPVNIPEWMLH